MHTPEYRDLMKERNSLEMLYRDGKINETTYKTRHVKLEKDIRLLNKKYEQINREKNK